MKKERIRWDILIWWIALCQAAGAIGALVSSNAIQNWYPLLQKPWFNPPSWVFGPAWTLLYTLMGIAVYLVWMKQPRTKMSIEALWIFCIQLVINAAWTPVFFYLHNPFAGLITIILLWVFVIATTYFFFRIHKAAGILLLPYAAWVTFALTLNYSIWMLNI